MGGEDAAGNPCNSNARNGFEVPAAANSLRNVLAE
jgi:hypothetical protein